MELLDVIFDRIVPVILFILMFSMGLTLRVADFQRLLRHPKPVFTGLFGQMIYLPCIAFAIGVLLGAPPELAAGAMILAACPGGVTSNGYVFVSRGDVGLSVSLTAITSLLTVVTIPFIAVFAMRYFYSTDATVSGLPVLDIMRALVTITAIPILLGMAVMHRWPQYREQAAEVARKLSLFFLIVIIVGITLSTLETLREHMLRAALLTIGLNVLGLAGGYVLAKIARLPPLQVRTIIFEVGVQNIGLAILVGVTILERRELAVFALVYALFMKITSLALVYWWRRNPVPAVASP